MFFIKSKNTEKQLANLRKLKEVAEAKGDTAGVERLENRVKTIQAKFLDGLR